MAMIIDANRSGNFSAPVSSQAREILLAIRNRKIRVAVGGRLLHELSRTPLLALIKEWGRSGALYRADDREVDRWEQNFAQHGLISDDPHIIALAHVTGVRLLYSDDRSLISDFKNTNLLRPKGKVMTSLTSLSIMKSLIQIHKE